MFGRIPVHGPVTFRGCGSYGPWGCWQCLVRCMRQGHTHRKSSKSHAIRSDTEKALAPQGVLSYSDAGQESAWRHVVLVVGKVSEYTGKGYKGWEVPWGFCASSSEVCTAV